VEVLVISVH